MLTYGGIGAQKKLTWIEVGVKKNKDQIKL